MDFSKLKTIMSGNDENNKLITVNRPNSLKFEKTIGDAIPEQRYYKIPKTGFTYDKTFTMSGMEIDPMTGNFKDDPIVVSCAPDTGWCTAYSIVNNLPAVKMLQNPVIVGNVDRPLGIFIPFTVNDQGFEWIERYFDKDYKEMDGSSAFIMDTLFGESTYMLDAYKQDPCSFMSKV